MKWLWSTNTLLRSRNIRSWTLTYEQFFPYNMLSDDKKEEWPPYAGCSHGPWLLKVGVCPPAGWRACTVLSINGFYHIRQRFAGGCTLHFCVSPCEFPTTNKSHPSFFPSLSIFNTRRGHFMKKPGRLGSVFLLHFNPSTQPLLSAVAFPSQLEFKYSSQFILETPTAPSCQVQGDPLQFLLSPFFLLLSLLPLPSPSPPPPPPSSSFFPGRQRFLCAWGDWLNFTWAKL